MITDTLSQCARYFSLSPRFAAAFEFLKNIPADKPAGRYELDGDNCFALVQSYNTKPFEKATFESHQRYIDIQFIQSGIETMLWAPISTLKITQPYVAEKDVMFYATPRTPSQMTAINVHPGEFTVFFPEDGHAPGIECGSSCELHKVVIKVKA